MDIIASRLINKMILNQLIKTEEKDFYFYVFITRMEQFVTFSTILIIAAVNKVFLPTIFFLCTFFGIRKRSNGYHASSFKRCYFGSIGIYVFFLLIGQFVLLKNIVVTLLIMIISAAMLILIGAVNHPDINWDDVSFQLTKQLSREMVILETIVILSVAILGGNDVFIVFMSFGIVLNAILVLMGKMQKERKE